MAKLMVASYNNGMANWNADVEETAFISYRLTTRFNEPAECYITLADATGTIAQKYNVAANAVYIGPGQATIEDPNGTDVFFGRILRARSNTDSRTVELYCRDWLDQLDEEQITYDMREDLDGSGTRESVIKSDYDNTDGNGIAPAIVVGADKFVYDHDIGLTVDAHNGQYMMLSDKMAGAIKVRTGPYSSTVTGGGGKIDTFTHNISDLWSEDTDQHTAGDVGGAWNVVYKFKVWCPDSDFCQSVIGARIIMVYHGGTSDLQLQLYNGATYDTLDETWGNSSTAIVKKIFEIPANFLAGMFDANGEAWVKLNDPTDGAINLHYIAVEADCETTGYSSAISISDGTANRLTVGTDLTADAQKVWDGLPYSIAHEIYKHIDSDYGTLITGGDVMVALTCAGTIEHTSGISTRQYKDQTRLDILKDVARQDKAEFWLTNGGVILNYKSTWNDAVADETLTDADVNSWTASYDYQTLMNKAFVYGIRVGDRQLSSTYSSAASIAKYIATRTRVERSSGLVSEYDTLARATALVNQYSGVQMLLSATIAGNVLTAAHLKTLSLGYEVQVTSTYLGLANAWYIVSEIDYDSKDDISQVRLHPRITTTGLQQEENTSNERIMQYMRRGGPADKYIPAPETDIVP